MDKSSKIKSEAAAPAQPVPLSVETYSECGHVILYVYCDAQYVPLMQADCPHCRIASAPAPVLTHHYISTACQHGKHDQCRKVCKFCLAQCACTECNHEAVLTQPSADGVCRKNLDKTCRSASYFPRHGDYCYCGLAEGHAGEHVCIMCGWPEHESERPVLPVPPEWKVGHDGPSRPIIEHGMRMFSINEFISGKWESFDDEEEISQAIVDALNARASSQAVAATDDLVIEICRELYDRFMMGGWEPQDAHDWVRERLKQ